MERQVKVNWTKWNFQRWIESVKCRFGFHPGQFENQGVYGGFTLYSRKCELCEKFEWYSR